MTQESPANDGLLRSKPPKPSLAIGKERVLLGVAIIGVLLTIGIVIGSGPVEPPKAQASTQVSQPGYNVTSLPSTYSELPVPTPLPTLPSLREAKIQTETSPLAQLQAKMLEEKLRRAQSARTAPVAFQNVSVKDGSDRHHVMQDTDSSDSQQASSLPQSINPRDEANRQDEKNSFLNTKRADSVTLNQRLIRQTSPYQLMAGTLIPGLLLTGLNSDLPGQILGQVSQNVFDSTNGKHLLIPQGTKVLGQYDSRIVYGQQRMLVVWTRLIFPDGKSISLEGMPGVDLSGYAGLSDQVNNHWSRLITGVVLSSLLSAGAQMAEGRNYNTFDPNYGDLAAQGMARNVNQIGQQITQRNLNIQPTLEIRPGFRFNVFVNKDMVLEAYE